VEEDLRDVLLADTAVSALARAISWGEHPQGIALPGVVLTRVSGAEGMTMAGPDGLTVARVQIDCWARTYAGAVDLSRAVVAVLHGYRGGGFQGVFHLATRDGREGGSNAADMPFRVSLDFETFWRNGT